MTDIQIKTTDICKKVFLSILPQFVECARKDIAEGYLTPDEAYGVYGKCATDAANIIARQWLEH